MPLITLSILILGLAAPSHSQEDVIRRHQGADWWTPPAWPNDYFPIPTLRVQPENRCAPYKRSLYPYNSAELLNLMSKESDVGQWVYGPYDGSLHPLQPRYRWLKPQIDHVVALSEGHDSGLCNAPAAQRRRFAQDLFNTVPVLATTNGCSRNGKCAKDPAEWLPRYNSCWYALLYVTVKAQYALSIDVAEAHSLHNEIIRCRRNTPNGDPFQQIEAYDFLRLYTQLYDLDGDGDVTCDNVRAQIPHPVHYNTSPLYYFIIDGDPDGNGIACE